MISWLIKDKEPGFVLICRRCKQCEWAAPGSRDPGPLQAAQRTQNSSSLLRNRKISPQHPDANCRVGGGNEAIWQDFEWGKGDSLEGWFGSCKQVSTHLAEQAELF